jgi:sugar-specific transcriptional regulator TrmB
MDMHATVTSLRHLGFTENEAKVYIALVQSNPANGNAIAVASGVPGPKVYEIVRRLQEKGVVFAVSSPDHGTSIRYSPLPFRKLLADYSKSFSAHVGVLESAFEELESASDTDWSALYAIRGYDAALAAIVSAMEGAHNSILLSCWSTELQACAAGLYAADARGVCITSLLYDGRDLMVPWRTFHHHPSSLARQRHAGEMAVVVDGSKSIVLESRGDGPHAVVSSEPAMVRMAVNYIRHDIYINRVASDMPDEMERRYGGDLERLINDF